MNAPVPANSFRSRPRDVRPLILLGICMFAFAVSFMFAEPDRSAVAQPRDFGLQDARDPHYSTDPIDPFPMPPEMIGVNLMHQSDEEKCRKSTGCIECHKTVGDPHQKDTVRLGCTDCHGGDAATLEKDKAHVTPRYPQFWPTAANPPRTYALLNHESPEFIRFVNPGDLRVAHISCGTAGCHAKEVQTNRKQIMTTGAMLWGSALYNNGSVPFKRSRFGEVYSMNGAPLRLRSNPLPDEFEMKRGVVPFLDPLPRFEVGQPGNVLRIFERGGRFRPEVGIPERLEESGRPRTRLSERGLGTENRTDPVLVSLNKTRLFDPTLNFLGTNDHPGDYRSSGCTACHVVYANDRSTVNSGPYAKFGNRGLSFSSDPTIPNDEPGHPIQHRFTNSIPTSQCIVCHIHPGTTVMNSFLGYMWWDQETEAHLMYPAKQKNPTAEEYVRAAMLNPEEASARGNWGNQEFLNDIIGLNSEMSKTQFADFHGHGWVFRAVFKRDREGNLRDFHGAKVGPSTPKLLRDGTDFPCMVKAFHKDGDPALKDSSKLAKDECLKVDCERDGKPVHLMDIHLEKGMHCVDCHFSQDVHGNNRLHMEVRAACEIQCVDCHGTVKEYATLRTSGPASYTSAPGGQGRNLMALTTPFKKQRFEIQELGDGKKRFFQNSAVEPNLKWEIVQTADTIDEKHPRYNAKSALAKTVRFEGDKMVWGDLPLEGEKGCAHKNSQMSCIACHSAWNPSCYGCHLPQRANLKMPQLHVDGEVSRNYVPYNFQTLRDDIFMLARDGDATGNRIGPARSSCAVHVGSYNNNRESIYVQQQTISAEGFGGTAFSTNVPHTVRGKGWRETKQCTDCHLSKNNDNNAWMAQLLMQGTNYLNLIGRYCWVAAGAEGLLAVVVTERDEPQAVIGSAMHKYAFPNLYKKHVERGRLLEHAHEHPGRDISAAFRPGKKTEVLSVQARGEYLYAACGEGGVRVFDIAFIDNKAFSERITTAPVSPIGQRFYVPTTYATAVAAPTTVAVDPTRTHMPENKERKIHEYFGYLYIADRFEGLILVGAATTIDGNPDNNFLKRELTWNPDGILNGAENITIVGAYAYVCCDAGLVVVDLDKPKEPKVTKVIGDKFIKQPKAVQVQFRYAYVCDIEGIKILDVTDLARPEPKARINLPHVHNIYLARTHAFIAAGPRGLVIFDITNAESPKFDQIYDAGGLINDLHDVKLGITYNSQFAYLADGKNGMRVVQLTSPETPGNDGFSPRPTPQLIATYRIPHGGHALAISKGLDRDRAVDEMGNQIGVFGRVGARPLDGCEQRKMYLKPDGKPLRVSDDPNDADLYERRPRQAP